jgi:hypothetical protein
MKEVVTGEIHLDTSFVVLGHIHVRLLVRPGRCRAISSNLGAMLVSAPHQVM